MTEVFWKAYDICMDPKKLNELDPKLKAAYDRVMSTSVAAQPAAQTAPHVPATTIPVAPATHTTPLPASHAAIPPAKSIGTPVTTAEEKTKKGVSPIILVVGGIVFFALYAVLWIMVFKVKLPFIP